MIGLACTSACLQPCLVHRPCKGRAWYGTTGVLACLFFHFASLQKVRAMNPKMKLTPPRIGAQRTLSSPNRSDVPKTEEKNTLLSTIPEMRSPTNLPVLSLRDKSIGEPLPSSPQVPDEPDTSSEKGPKGPKYRTEGLVAFVDPDGTSEPEAESESLQEPEITPGDRREQLRENELPFLETHQRSRNLEEMPMYRISETERRAIFSEGTSRMAEGLKNKLPKK